MKNRNSTSVLVIDMLKDYFAGSPLKDKRAQLVTSINKLIRRARSQGVPIIWIRQEFSPDLSDAFPVMRKKNIRITIAGTEGCKILPELDRNPDDHKIVKKRYSAFFKTPLDDLIEKLGIKRLIICGINTHACVRMAAIDAYQRDLDVIIPRECVDSYDSEHHDVSLRYLGKGISKVMPLSEVLESLSN